MPIRPRHVLPTLLALAAGAAAATPAQAQCPDGSPPPCAAARRAAAARPAPPPPAERSRRFLVLPFRNITRAAEQEWLVEGSPLLIADALGRWQDISVVSDERLYPAMRRHGLQPGTVMDLPKIRLVAEETGGWTAVTGEVMALGPRVRVSARAYDVVTNREVLRVVAESQPGEDVRAAYVRIGRRLLAAAGLDSAALAVDAVTTRSLAAYQAYLRGVSHIRRSEVRRAHAALLEAVRLDSTFAEAYLRLAEASFALNPTDILDLTSPSIRYVDRAAAMADQLPPRRRDLVRGISDVVHGRLSAARTTFTRLVAADSNDVDALEWMGILEASDFILVPAPGGGERPRGSMNTALRLTKRVLELDPARHDLYSSLVVYYAQAAGYGGGIRAGHRRELPSLGALMMMVPARNFYFLMRDTLELVPTDSFRLLSDDTVRASRERAGAAALAWARRWRQEAPTEADAHLWMSRMYELSGLADSALTSLAVADSLGVETRTEVVAVRRMTLLARLGRFAEARRIADSLWTAGDFTRIVPTSRLDAALVAQRVYLAQGAWDRAEHVAAALADYFASQVGRGLADISVLGLLAAGDMGTQSARETNPAFVQAVVASLLREPPTGRAARWVAPQIGVAASLAHDDALRPLIANAARSLVQRGDTATGFRLALAMDSTGRASFEAEPWYAARRAALRATVRARAERFRLGTATLAGDSLVFAWTIAGGDTLTWNSDAAMPPRDEYSWRVNAAGHVAVLWYAATFSAGETHGTLAQLIPLTSRVVTDSASIGSVQAQLASAGRMRVDAVPGGLRMVVRWAPFLEAMRRLRPAEVQFRFRPCGAESQSDCPTLAVPVTYP